MPSTVFTRTGLDVSYGYIKTSYIALTKYVAELKRKSPTKCSTSNIGFGYLDYTYFYFTNDYVKSKNIKFALVLNHEKMQFELWLCARTADVQKQYWNLLKDSKWNINEMPKYSVLETVLVNQINFDNTEDMTENIVALFVKSRFYCNFVCASPKPVANFSSAFSFAPVRLTEDYSQMLLPVFRTQIVPEAL